MDLKAIEDSARAATPGRLAEIISDDDITRVHGRANFGDMSARDVVNDGVRKYAVGYQGGYTQISILLGHGLIKSPRPGSYDADLTKKGKRYARGLYQIDKEERAALTARIAALEALIGRFVAHDDDAKHNPMGGLSLGGLSDSRDNTGVVYQSHALAEDLAKARALQTGEAGDV